MEIFKDIKGYEGFFQISNLGRVKSLKRYTKNKMCEKDKILTSQISRNGKGYMIIMLFKNMKGKRFHIHKLIAEAFIPNLDNKPQINHINGIKLDNRIENLEWCTCKENIIHAYRTGLMVHYKKHKNKEMVEVNE